MEIPRTALLPDLAGYHGALQADCPGGSLGHPAACIDHGRVQHHLRRTGKPSLQWDPLPDLHLYRPAALAVICLRIDEFEQQPGGQSELDQQGLFSPSGHPAFLRIGRRGRFCHRFRCPAGTDGLVWHPSNACCSAFTGFPAAGIDQCLGSGFMAFSLERAIPGHPLRGSFSDPILDVCHSNCIFQRTDPRKLALVVQSQPDDRRSGGFSLGDPGQEQPGPAFVGDLGRGGGGSVDRRSLLFQAYGSQFCGRHLNERYRCSSHASFQAVPVGGPACPLFHLP